MLSNSSLLSESHFAGRLLNTEARPAGGKESGDACMRDICTHGEHVLGTFSSVRLIFQSVRVEGLMAEAFAGKELLLWQVQEAASCVTGSGCDPRTSALCRLDSHNCSHIRMRHGRTPTHQMLAGQRQEAE